MSSSNLRHRLVVQTLEDRSVPAVLASLIPAMAEPVAASCDLSVQTCEAEKVVDDPIVTTQVTTTSETPPPAPVPAPSPVPAPTHPFRFAVGSGPGAPGIVSIYDAPTNALLATHTPYGRDFTGGIRVATADFSGDGIDDLAIVNGTGAPRVIVIDGATQKQVMAFTPWVAGASGGAFLSTGDVTGDGRPDLIVGSGVGQSPEVRVYRGQDVAPAATGSLASPQAVRSFIPMGVDSAFGARVAAGDFNRDGKAEIVVASKSTVTVHAMQNEKVEATPNRRSAVLPVRTTPVMSFGFAADTKGVFVATGDYTGSGRTDIAAGFVSNGRAKIRVISGADFKSFLMDSFGFTAVPDGGIPIAMRDVTGDGRAEVIAAGGQGTSLVRVIGGGMGGLTRSFMSFTPEYQGGVFTG